MTGPSWRILAIPRHRTLSFWLNPASLMVASLLTVLTLDGLVRILELIELKTDDLRFVSRGRRSPRGR